jgi:hypothetical protein
LLRASYAAVNSGLAAPLQNTSHPGSGEKPMRSHLTVVGAALGIIAAWAVCAALLAPPGVTAMFH